jgi:hypothetical protein
LQRLAAVASWRLAIGTGRAVPGSVWYTSTQGFFPDLARCIYRAIGSQCFHNSHGLFKVLTGRYMEKFAASGLFEYSMRGSTISVLATKIAPVRWMLL